MKRINTIEQISEAASKRQSLVVPTSICFCKPRPAAWIIHMSGYQICRLLSLGLYVYRPLTRHASGRCWQHRKGS